MSGINRIRKIKEDILIRPAAASEDKIYNTRPARSPVTIWGRAPVFLIIRKYSY